MNSFSKRPVAVYELPLAEGLNILRPEQVILKFGIVGSVDVGSLCYLSRSSNKRRATNDCKLVDLSTFNRERANVISNFIGYISEQYANSGSRVKTVHGKIQAFVSLFMQWADMNSHFEALHNQTSARSAFQQYVCYLREKSHNNTISVNTAARLQEKAMLILEDFLCFDGLAQGINLIRRSANAIEPTMPPSEDDQSKVLALSDALFSGLSDLVIDCMPYPFRLNMPKYLNWSNNYLWIFPTSKWCLPPTKVIKSNREYWAYSYDDGQLAKLEDIEGKYCNRGAASLAVKLANELILNANSNKYHTARRQAAMQANLAFVVMFIANTGMNKAQVFDLTWDDNYEVGIERQGFRTIKWRAEGRVCHFDIKTSFLPKFKRFLQLRRYLLNDRQCGYLFLTLGARKAPVPKKMVASDLNNFYRTQRIIDPQLPNVSPRKWRAAKSDWLIKNTDPATAAIILQNSEKTTLKHYAAGSETNHLDEMSSFLEGISETVISKVNAVESEVERAVGVCSSYNSPHKIRDDVSIVPDCQSPEGCLFCDKFRVHADAYDTKKLISCRYCIQQTSHLATTVEQYQKLFSPIIDRINALLDEINNRGEFLVADIIREVEEDGELTTFWASKLEMLTALELIA